MDGLLALSGGLPQGALWVPLMVLGVLGSVALYDALTGRVPDAPIFFCLMVLVGALGLYLDWDSAAKRLMIGLVVMAVPFVVNELYYRVMDRDAIGLGDAKWSLLAATCFGAVPVAVAWVVGAWLALGFMGCVFVVRFITAKWRKSSRAKLARVHFAPFLFLGLALYFLYQIFF